MGIKGFLGLERGRSPVKTVKGTFNKAQMLIAEADRRNRSTQGLGLTSAPVLEITQSSVEVEKAIRKLTPEVAVQLKGVPAEKMGETLRANNLL